jgi:hypothetical protein
MTTKKRESIYTPLELRKLREQREYEIVKGCLMEQVSSLGAVTVTRLDIQGWVDLAELMLDELEE